MQYLATLTVVDGIDESARFVVPNSKSQAIPLVVVVVVVVVVVAVVVVVVGRDQDSDPVVIS